MQSAPFAFATAACAFDRIRPAGTTLVDGRERSNLERFRLRHKANHGIDKRLCVDRLREMRVKTGLQGAVPVVLSGKGRERSRGNRSAPRNLLCPDATNQAVSVLAHHRDIREEDIDMFGTKHAARVRCGRGGSDSGAVALQCRNNKLPAIVIVIHNEYRQAIERGRGRGQDVDLALRRRRLGRNVFFISDRKTTESRASDGDPASHRGLRTDDHDDSAAVAICLMLSIFLAGGLRQNWSGFAPVLLDDPVTHFDDLNAYGFVELIRGIVATSPNEWQFIISTCEQHLFELMQKKFSKLDSGSIFYEFLGLTDRGPIVERR